MTLTAQAAHLAELRAENDQLRHENEALRAMQALINAKAAKVAALDRDLPHAWRVA